MIICLFLLSFTFFFQLDKLFFAWFIPIIVTSLWYLCSTGGSLLSFSFFVGYIRVDYFRILLIFLTFWVFYYCVLCFEGFKTFFFMWLMFLFLTLCFLVDNFILFYVFFEVVFILIFIFLLRWGKTLERVQASFYIFFYTLFFSLPFFIFIIYIYIYRTDVGFFSLKFFTVDFNWLVLFLIIVFIVKLPLYGVHLWLPKAHVEAPITGSILLAGVLLKLGAYGLFRFFPYLCCFSNSFFFWNIFFYFSIIGGVIISLICLRQSDLKIIIAYSSIVHIRFIIVGFISFTDVGLIGSVLILVAHGFISPFLFFGLNYIYEVFHSRRIFILKGVILFIPIFCFFWFIGVILNIGFPPFISFFSEVIISIGLRFLGLFDWGVILIFFFFCGAYNIYLYIFPIHGNFTFFSWVGHKFHYVFLGLIHFYFVLVHPVLFFIWLISLKKNISLWN